jgi:tetratricopeptide (TPR) repeat protein
MKLLSTLLFSAGLCCLAAAPLQAQQLRLPAMSPTVRLREDFSTSYIELVYARPSKRGREVFGKLVPYGEVWRTGANSSTRIKFGEEVKFGGQVVPAGTYALFTIPDPKEWTIILNKDTSQWGAYDYRPELDLLRVKAKPRTSNTAMESFSIGLENLQPEAAELTLRWDKSRVSVPIMADPDARIMAQIEAAMKTDKKPYFAAAQYYYSTGKDLNQAITWLDESIKQQPSYYAYYWKGKMLQKADRKAEAAEAARQSLALVKSEKNAPTRDEYTRLNEQLLKEVGGKKR